MDMYRIALVVVLVSLEGCTNLLAGDPIANCRASPNCTVTQAQPTYGPPHQAIIKPAEPYKPKPTPPN